MASYLAKGSDLKRLLQTLGIVMLLVLAGCAATTRHAGGSSAPMAQVNLSGYPPAFREGYTDGCASAGSTTQRDEKRYQADPQYKYGWRDGKDICSRQR